MGNYLLLIFSERKEFIHKEEQYLKKKFPKLYYIG